MSSLFSPTPSWESTPLAPSQPPNWWLRHTSGWDLPQRTIEQRNQGRRSTLASWFILALLLADCVLLPVGIGSPVTLAAIIVVFLGLLFAAFLNRRGLVTGVGLVIIFLIIGGVMGSLLSQSTLTLDSLPAYDLLTIAVIVGAFVLPRQSAFGVAALNLCLIFGDFLLQPQSHDLQADIAFYSNSFTGTLALLARPIALQIMLAVFSYLMVRLAESEIARADRAEVVARLEHQAAEERRQLEEGVKEMVEILAKAANGQTHLRISEIKQRQLWIIANAINNLLNRMQRYSANEHLLQRTTQEIHRLAAAIRDAQDGRWAQWPGASETPLDEILALIPRNRPLSPTPPTTAWSPPTKQPDPRSNPPELWRNDQERKG